MSVSYSAGGSGPPPPPGPPFGGSSGGCGGQGGGSDGEKKRQILYQRNRRAQAEIRAQAARSIRQNLDFDVSPSKVKWNTSPQSGEEKTPSRQRNRYFWRENYPPDNPRTDEEATAIRMTIRNQKPSERVPSRWTLTNSDRICNMIHNGRLVPRRWNGSGSSEPTTPVSPLNNLEQQPGSGTPQYIQDNAQFSPLFQTSPLPLQGDLEQLDSGFLQYPQGNNQIDWESQESSNIEPDLSSFSWLPEIEPDIASSQWLPEVEPGESDSGSPLYVLYTASTDAQGNTAFRAVPREQIPHYPPFTRFYVRMVNGRTGHFHYELHNSGNQH